MFTVVIHAFTISTLYAVPGDYNLGVARCFINISVLISTYEIDWKCTTLIFNVARAATEFITQKIQYCLTTVRLGL